MTLVTESMERMSMRTKILRVDGSTVHRRISGSANYDNQLVVMFRKENGQFMSSSIATISVVEMRSFSGFFGKQFITTV